MIKELLQSRSKEEWADIKGVEIAKIGKVPKQNIKFSDSDYDIEIVDIKPIDGGVETFVKAWLPNGEQIGFGKDGTVEIEKFRIKNPPILVDDPAGDIIKTDPITGKERRLKENLQEALLQVLAHTIKVVPKFDGGRIVSGKIGSTHTTYYPQPGTGTAPIDGTLNRNVGNPGEAFGTIRGGAGTDADDTSAASSACALNAGTNTDAYAIMRRFGAGFDTSDIADGDTITAGTFSPFSHDSAPATGLGDTDADVVSFTPANAADFVASDYNAANFGTTRFATGKAISGITQNTYQDYALNASGLDNISKTGNSFFGIRTKWDVDNSFGGSWVSGAETRLSMYQADEAGTTKDPKLVVTHSSAAVAAGTLLMMGVG